MMNIISYAMVHEFAAWKHVTFGICGPFIYLTLTCFYYFCCLGILDTCPGAKKKNRENE